MASFSGYLHRSVSAMAAVAVAAMSTDIPDRFHHPNSNESITASKPETSEPLISRISISDLSFIKNYCNPILTSSSFASSTTSLPALMNVHRYAKLVKPSKDQDYKFRPASSNSDVLYRRHLSDPNSVSGKCSSVKSQTVVVLLGWLEAKQRHLKR